MEVAIPESLPLERFTQDQLAAMSPFGVVTAIHNMDQANDDIAWYAACRSEHAHAQLWSRHWLGGPYAAAFFPCPDRVTADKVREALEHRDWAAAERRLAHERASDMDSLDSFDTIDLTEIFGEAGVENLYRR